MTLPFRPWVIGCSILDLSKTIALIYLGHSFERMTWLFVSRLTCHSLCLDLIYPRGNIWSFDLLRLKKSKQLLNNLCQSRLEVRPWESTDQPRAGRVRPWAPPIIPSKNSWTAAPLHIFFKDRITQRRFAFFRLFFYKHQGLYLSSSVFCSPWKVDLLYETNLSIVLPAQTIQEKQKQLYSTKVTTPSAP